MSALLASIERRQREDAYMLRMIWRGRMQEEMTQQEIMGRMEEMRLVPPHAGEAERKERVARLLSRTCPHWVVRSAVGYRPNPDLVRGQG